VEPTRPVELPPPVATNSTSYFAFCQVHLKELNLSGNLLTGQIPEVIASLSELRTLALSSNRLMGLVPEGLGQPPQNHLSSVRLQDNDLCGYAPPGVLRIIGMGSQVLLPAGLCLPDEMGDLGDELEYLDLSGMSLDGWLPPSIGTLIHLEELYLHDNKVRERLRVCVHACMWAKAHVRMCVPLQLLTLPLPALTALALWSDPG
jgi:hypothetical protein